MPISSIITIEKVHWFVILLNGWQNVDESYSPKCFHHVMLLLYNDKYVFSQKEKQKVLKEKFYHEQEHY